MRVLAGIQSSGKLHLGNYLGAMTQYLSLQREHECFFFIANYHALTSIHDAGRLAALTRDAAIDHLAVGLDPERCCLFRQTDVPEVTELCWILSTATGKGLMERATSYKDKTAKGIAPSMGLFCYPILMAADILIFRSDWVPVGKDQTQHVEMAQDIAGYFNQTVGAEVLKRPEIKLNEAMVVPGLDGQKMSKSYGNTIDLFDTPKNIRKRIMSIKTDSTPVEAPKDPAQCNVMAIYRLVAGPIEVRELESAYRAGGMGYGDAKQKLYEALERVFGPARERRERLIADQAYLEDVLQTCGRRARAVARETMAEVRDACGLIAAKDTHR